MAPSAPGSGSATPDRFITTAPNAEDVLKEQTIGLVHLSDFRKKRTDALDQSGHDSSESEGRNLTSKPTVFKKKRKIPTETLSFANEDENNGAQITRIKAKDDHDTAEDAAPATTIKKKFKPNASMAFTPQSQSKQALARDAQLKQTLQAEYILKQELLKASEFILPFVFFDGKDTPGGRVRIRKGDPVWLFLERARKVGAEGAGKNNVARKDWARISVDDLMVLRQDLILPTHFDFYHFIHHQCKGYQGLLFPLSSEPAADASVAAEPAGLGSRRPEPTEPALPDSVIEGFSDDPILTKVVDRRWYERNKHIFPANIWEEYDATRDYLQGGRKDREGNQMFFNR